MKSSVSRLALSTLLVGTVLLTSCQQFFTTSIASSLARTSYNIPADMPVDDAMALLDTALAQGDSALAAALVTPLLAAAKAASDDPTSDAYNEAASALASAVVLSSGVGSTMTNLASLFLAGDQSTDDEELMTSILDTISTITLTAPEIEALVMISEHPPVGLSADDAYAAAVALVSNAFATNSSDLADMDSLTPEQIDEISADPSMVAALALIEYAQSQGSGGSLIGGILGDFDLSDFEN